MSQRWPACADAAGGGRSAVPGRRAPRSPLDAISGAASARRSAPCWQAPRVGSFWSLLGLAARAAWRCSTRGCSRRHVDSGRRLAEDVRLIATVNPSHRARASGPRRAGRPRRRGERASPTRAPRSPRTTSTARIADANAPPRGRSATGSRRCRRAGAERARLQRGGPDPALQRRRAAVPRAGGDARRGRSVSARSVFGDLRPQPRPARAGGDRSDSSSAKSATGSQLRRPPRRRAAAACAGRRRCRGAAAGEANAASSPASCCCSTT